jgi:hypothetical protein
MLHPGAPLQYLDTSMFMAASIVSLSASGTHGDASSRFLLLWWWVPSPSPVAASSSSSNLRSHDFPQYAHPSDLHLVEPLSVQALGQVLIARTESRIRKRAAKRDKRRMVVRIGCVEKGTLRKGLWQEAGGGDEESNVQRVFCGPNSASLAAVGVTFLETPGTGPRNSHPVVPA